MVDLDAWPSWMEECQIAVGKRRLWTTLRRGRLLLDPGEYKGLYLANKSLKQLIDTYRWKNETMLRFVLSPKIERVGNGSLFAEPDVMFWTALEDLHWLQVSYDERYGLQLMPNMLLLEVDNRVAIPKEAGHVRAERQRREICATNNFLISCVRGIGKQFIRRV